LIYSFSRSLRDLEPLKRGGYNAGRPCRVTNNPNPFFIRRGFRPLPKPLANLWQGDVIDSGQGPPYVKVLVSLAKPVP